MPGVRLATALTILVVGVLAAGCGGEAAEETAPVAPSTTVAPTTVPPTTTVAPTTTGPTTTGAADTDIGLEWAPVPEDEALFGSAEVWSAAAGGPGLVAVGADTSGDDWVAAAWVSEDGYTWSRVPHDEGVFGGPGVQVMYAVTAGGPGLVAVGRDEGELDYEPAVWVSADGYGWTRIEDEAALARGYTYSATAGGPGLVVAGTENEAGTTTLEDGSGWADDDAAVWLSADGYTWTRIEDEALGGPMDQWISAVTAGGPGLVAVGGGGSGIDDTLAPNGAVWVSADGYTWTRIVDDAVFAGVRFSSVAAGPGGLVAVGGGWDDYGMGSAFVSEDGYTWTPVETGEGYVGSVTAGGPGWVAAGLAEDSETGAVCAVWVSEDAQAWTRVGEQALGGCTRINFIVAWDLGLVAFDRFSGPVAVSPPPG